MVAIAAGRLAESLQQWRGERVYIHLEVNPGAYWRSGSAILDEAHVKGDGPCRVFLELDGRTSLIQIDQLTHMELSAELIIATAYDEHERLARTILISRAPFSL